MTSRKYVCLFICIYLFILNEQQAKWPQGKQIKRIFIVIFLSLSYLFYIIFFCINAIFLIPLD